jgi:iron complex transport system substrate-binding protein
LLVACALVLTTLVAAPAANAAQGDFPVTIDAPNGKVRIDERPERIVSLAPALTEMLYAIGAGEQVVAVDDESDYPKGVPTTDLSGFEPNAEAILGYEPDLVVTSETAVVDLLKDIDIPVVVEPAVKRIEQTYVQIEQLGIATGNEGGAKKLVRKIKRGFDALLAKIAERSTTPTAYWELDDTYFSVTSDTFIGQLLELAGIENIADAVEDTNDGYPQLSAEYIVESDPDFIFLADTECCDQSAETVAARPGWSDIAAVRDDHVVELNDDVASRWGPRVVKLFRQIVDATTE